MTGLKGKIINLFQKSQPLLYDCARGSLLTCPSDYRVIGNEKTLILFQFTEKQLYKHFISS